MNCEIASSIQLVKLKIFSKSSKTTVLSCVFKHIHNPCGKQYNRPWGQSDSSQGIRGLLPGSPFVHTIMTSQVHAIHPSSLSY